MKKLKVIIKNEKISLVKYILDLFQNLKRPILYKAIRNKDIRINNIKITKDTIVSNGDVLTIYIDDYLLYNIPKKLEYIYKDNNIIAVFKPQGILSNIEYDTYNINFEPTLESIVQKDFPTSKICHRLDRNTSGIILFSNNNTSYNEIIDGFKYGLIKKEYIAYVSGCDFEKEHDILNKYILKNSKTGYSDVLDNMIKNSQKIVTEYTVLGRFPDKDYSILNICIPTGKTHQIRAQMKYISHPLIGDSKYGTNEINKKFKIYKQLLFAYKYTFNFEKTSPLYYLNNTCIKLDEDIYSNKI